MRRKLYLAGVSLVAMTCGALVSAQTSTETYSYDPLGRLVKVVTVGGDNNGRPVQVFARAETLAQLPDLKLIAMAATGSGKVQNSTASMTDALLMQAVLASRGLKDPDEGR